MSWIRSFLSLIWWNNNNGSTNVTVYNAHINNQWIFNDDRDQIKFKTKQKGLRDDKTKKDLSKAKSEQCIRYVYTGGLLLIYHDF